MRHTMMLDTLVAAVTLLGLAGCGEDEPETFDVSGSLVINGASMFGSYNVGWVEGEACGGDDGFEDIRSAQIIIYDNTDAKIATGELDEEGVVADHITCVFDFTVSDVPVAEKDIYSIEIGDRGKVTFEQADADSLGLSIG